MNKTKLPDEQLVKRYVSGDESCLEIRLKRHQQRLFGYIMLVRRNRAEAEDIFQETFFRIIRKLRAGEYNEEGKFLPWAMRIAHNLCIDEYRLDAKMPTISHVKDKKTSEEVDIFSVIKLEGDEDNERELMDREKTRELKRMVRLLPAEQREVVMLRLAFDLSFKEIADATGSNINTTLGRMRYAVIRLREMIKDSEVFRDHLQQADAGG